MAPTHSVHLRTAYWSDPAAKAAFCALAQDAFHLDLSEWDAAGFWDDAFHPFTYFDPTGRAVANVCVYSMRLVIAGRPVKAAQLSTVATVPALRRQGLARTLTNAALAWAEATGHEFIYLFASDYALPFYSALGFSPVAEHLTVLSLSTSSLTRQPGATPLNLATPADRALLYRLALGRCPVSRQLGALNARLLLFHALGRHRAGTMYLAPFDVAVLFRRTATTLTIYDIVGRRLPPLVDLLPFILNPGDREVVLRFMPDALGDLSALGRCELRLHAGSNLHLRGPAPLDPPFVFPATAEA